MLPDAVVADELAAGRRGRRRAPLHSAFTPSEIEAIGADARRRAHNAVFLLVTHADYDHVCGLPYFPEAEVDTYDIRGGNARRALADLGAGA